MISWISRAWAKVDADSIIHSFKRCGITNALDGSENGDFNRKLQDAVDSYRREAECREDAAYCILDEGGNSDSDSDFEGFSDTEQYDEEDEIPLAEVAALHADT